MLTTVVLSLSLVISPTVRVKVEGDGYLQFVKDGHAVYASSAPLTVVNGWLSTPDGSPMLPTVRVPNGARSVDVDPEGNVYVALNTFKAKVGRISLALFDSNDYLQKYGSFIISPDKPRLTEPGEDAGLIKVLRPGESLAPTVAPATANPLVLPTVSSADPIVRRWVDSPETLREAPTLPTFAPRSGSASITVSNKSETLNDRYTLGEIAVIDADLSLRQALWSVEIGDTPAYGRTLKLKKSQILSSLKKIGFDTKDFEIELARGATLTRRAQPVERDAIAETAIEAAAKLLGDSNLTAKARLSEDVAPVGEIEYVAETCIRTNRGATVIVVTKVDGERFSSHVVKVSRESGR